MDVLSQVESLKSMLNIDHTYIFDMVDIVRRLNNLTVIFYPLSHKYSGVCYKSQKSNVIVINSNMSLGRQHFSFAHELYHIYFDNEERSLDIESIDVKSEKNADKFASYFLIPKEGLLKHIKKIKGRIRLEHILYLEQHFRVSHKAMLIRLLKEGYITENDYDNYRKDFKKIALKYGYDTRIYYPSKKKMRVIGYYLNKARELFKNDKISVGKYKELLNDSFNYAHLY